MQESPVVIRSDANLLSVASQWHRLLHLNPIADFSYRFLHPHEDVARISPLGHAHLNVLGRYTFELDQTIQPGALRPLRTTDLRSTC